MASVVPTLLILLLAVPVAAAAVVAVLGPERRPAVRVVSLCAVLFNLAMTILILIPAVPRLQSRSTDGITFRPEFEKIVPILPLGPDSNSAIQFYIGLDGLNIWLVVLTSVLMLPAVLIGWESIKERANEYYAWLLLLQTAMTGVFLAFDLILFYVFFELTLVPLFFLIGIWGGSDAAGSVAEVLSIHPGGQPNYAARSHRDCLNLPAARRNGQRARIDLRDSRPGPHRAGIPRQRSRRVVLWYARADRDFPGCWPWDSPSRSRFFRCTPGCRSPIRKPRRPAAFSWRESCSSSALMDSCAFVFRSRRTRLWQSACR